MTDEEKEAIEYLKARLVGNEGCYLIDVAQSDLRIFLNLVENQQKGMKNWEEIYDEDQNYIGELNDKIFDLKFEVKNLQKEIEELNKSDASKEQSSMDYYNLYKELEDKIKAQIEELDKKYKEAYNKGFKTDMINRLREIKLMQSLLEKE